METSFMKMLTWPIKNIAAPGTTVILSIFLLVSTSCHKNNHNECLSCDCLSKNNQQVNLVSDTASFTGVIIDNNLVNAWGIALGPTGAFWISSNGAGLSVIYNNSGNTLLSPVTIPAPGGGAGAPTGAVFNNTTSFLGTKFLFATEDGTIVSWTSGATGVIQADRSATMAVYKGLAIASNQGNDYIYATNFRSGAIDVFDTNFHLVNGMSFTDPQIPAGFAPFNIRNINGELFVTYAKQKPDKHDDLAGSGNGYVDVFRPDGSLKRRFAAQGTLNSPWGITPGCAGLGGNANDDVILISNFGDGRINVYNGNGNFLGQLKNGNTPVTIQGIWAIESNVSSAPGKIYFTAGPFDESHGLFGYLQKN
ncbi:TIGR03118 family protein [Chitinophaga sp. Hz27]|uniref:TIGR03118 family protein n=1 Tax=Chitinophaga sp. Hz27 TaxID=3347169 RepID=UPI0035DE371D